NQPKVTHSSTTDTAPTQSSTPNITYRESFMVKAPTKKFELLQLPDAGVQAKPDHANQEHPGDHQVVTLAGVARIDNQVSQAGIDRDHFRGHHHQPGHSQCDAQTDDDPRQC